MNKKVFYVAPSISELELVQEGVLCSSERNGGIDQLYNDTENDWSNELWNNN